MKKIYLSQDHFAQVDDEDFEYLNQWKWWAHKDRSNYYAYSNSINGNKRTIISMHSLIVNIPKGMVTDHIDHNGLNNQKSNLRACTFIQNLYNKKPKGFSKYLGVHKNNSSFSAKIKIGREQIYLGSNKIEKLMAKRYDMAAIYFHGEFANLNFK